MDLGIGGDYVKFCGITSVDRTPLYASNKDLSFLLELTNNLDFIAKNILGGDLDKMVLKSEYDGTGKCLFLEKNDLLYIVYGRFPDKEGKWILEQMSNHFSELTRGKDVEKLDKFDKYKIETEFKRRTRFILEQYVRLQEIFTDQEIPYVEDTIRIDYLGLSSMSIGVISILLGEENLNFDPIGEFDSPEEDKEMKESMLTARIEAIAANTQGNTGSTPRWIAVKLGFQKYRFLTFKKLENDYFLSMISEGNLSKIEQVENLLEPKITLVTSMVFSGNLKPFNKLKIDLEDDFSKRTKFPPFSFKTEAKGSIMEDLEHLIPKTAQLGSEELFSSGLRKENGDYELFFPYPFIFKPPKPPDDFAMAPQVKNHTPLKDKDIEDVSFCQYCGMKITKEERFTHSCKKKPK